MCRNWIVIAGRGQFHHYRKPRPACHGNSARKREGVIARRARGAAEGLRQRASRRIARHTRVDIDDIGAAVAGYVKGDGLQVLLPDRSKDVRKPRRGGGVAEGADLAQRVVRILAGEVRDRSRGNEGKRSRRGGIDSVVIGDPEVAGLTKRRAPTVLDQERAVSWRSGLEVGTAEVVVPTHQRHGVVEAGAAGAVEVVCRGAGIVVVTLVHVHASCNRAIRHHRVLEGGIVERIVAAGENDDVLYVHLWRQTRRGSVCIAGVIGIVGFVDRPRPTGQICCRHTETAALTGSPVETTQVLQVILRKHARLRRLEFRFHGAIRGKGPAVAATSLVPDFSDLAGCSQIVTAGECRGRDGEGLRFQVGKIYRIWYQAESMSAGSHPREKHAAPVGLDILQEPRVEGRRRRLRSFPLLGFCPAIRR